MLEAYGDILTAKDVAEILHVTPRMVYEYCDHGAIRHFRLTTADGRPMRRVFIPKQALLDYLDPKPTVLIGGRTVEVQE